LGKAGNFGLIYGMGVEGFHTYAQVNYGVKLTIEEAAAFRDGFFDTYTKLPEYHVEYKAFARLHGFVRSPLGRIRHLPLINSPKRDIQSGAERQAINSPVQSTLSDMLIWATSIAHKNGWFKESPGFGAIHDAKYTYIPEDNWEKYAHREIEVMENLPFNLVGWNPQLKFTADGKVGANMADLEEI
jgi:DNA polymerase I-like protein with 3'-5' exonuclease and polymerase domains